MRTVETECGYKLFKPEVAISTAAMLNSTDDWVYTPVHCHKGTGLSFIEVRDEEGVMIGKM